LPNWVRVSAVIFRSSDMVVLLALLSSYVGSLLSARKRQTHRARDETRCAKDPALKRTAHVDHGLTSLAEATSRV
jgi:hypothetical protein